MMKKVKRCICLLLATVMLLSAAPLSGFLSIELPEWSLSDLFVSSSKAAEIVNSGYCGGEGGGSNLTWMLDSDGVLTISGVGTMEDFRSYYWAYEDYEPRPSPWRNHTIDSEERQNTPYATPVGPKDYFIKKVTINKGVTNIGIAAFEDCRALSLVSIPNSVTSIDYEAFDGCIGLTYITIPDSVTRFEGNAFLGCENLKDVYYSGSAEQWKAIEGNGQLINVTKHYNSSGPNNELDDVFNEKAYIAKKWTESNNYYIDKLLSLESNYCSRLCDALDGSGINASRDILKIWDLVLDPVQSGKKIAVDAVKLREMMILKLIYEALSGKQYENNLVSERISTAKNVIGYISTVDNIVGLRELFKDEKILLSFSEKFSKKSTPSASGAILDAAKTIVDFVKDLNTFVEKLSLYLTLSNATDDLIDSLILIGKNSNDNYTTWAINRIVKNLKTATKDDLILRLVLDGQANIYSDLAGNLTDCLLNCIPVYRELRAIYGLGKEVLNLLTASIDIIDGYNAAEIVAELHDAARIATSKARHYYTAVNNNYNAAVYVTSVYLLGAIIKLDIESAFSVYQASMKGGLYNYLSSSALDLRKLETTHTNEIKLNQDKINFLQYYWIIDDDSLKKDYPTIYSIYIQRVFKSSDAFAPTIEYVFLDKTSGKTNISIEDSPLLQRADGFSVHETVGGEEKDYTFNKLFFKMSVLNGSKITSFPKKYKVATYEKVDETEIVTSAYSDEVALESPLKKPTLDVQNTGSGIRITIHDSTPIYYDNIEYLLYRAEKNSDNYSQIGTINRNTYINRNAHEALTEYYDKTASDGVVYSYHVLSSLVFDSGSSLGISSDNYSVKRNNRNWISYLEVGLLQSTQKKAPKRMQAPAADVDHAVFAGYNNGITLSWEGEDGIAKYEVLRRHSFLDVYVSIGETTEATFTDQTAISNEEYVYVIRCYDADGSILGQSEEITASWCHFQIVAPDFSVAVNDSLTLFATTENNVEWSSSDKTVASVNSDGAVTGLKCGTTVITATVADGVSDSVTITVTEKTAEEPEEDSYCPLSEDSIHDWVETETKAEPTCTEDGIKIFTCSLCEETKTVTVSAIGHRYGAWEKVDSSQHQRVCANDKTHVQKENHKWDKVTITFAATATTAGKKTYTCTACGATKTETIPPTGNAEEISTAKVKLNWTSKAYNGAVQKPTIVVMAAQGGILTEGSSYTVDYKYSADSKYPGTYTVTATVTGKGNYTGTVTKKLTYKITAQALAASRVKLNWTSKPYNGAVQKPTVVVTAAQGGTMTEGKSYTVTYQYSAESKYPGTYTVTATVTGKGNYTGTVTKKLTYNITKQAINASRVTLNWTSKAYNGAVQKPTVVVTSAEGNVMTEGTSYTVTYQYSAESKKPGTYTVTATVTGKGNFTGTVTKKLSYTITAQALAASRVKLDWTSKAYNGAVQKPTAVVTSAQGKTMTEGTSYTVAYQYSANSKMPGTYTVTATVTGKGNFTGKVTKKFTYQITAQPLDASRVKLSWSKKAYNGAVQKPTVAVTSAQGGTMTEGKSYSVTYQYSAESRKPGTYTVTATVTGKGNYTGKVTKKLSYTITAQPLDVSRVKLSWSKKAYNGAVQQPTVVVTSAQGNVMTEGTSYTVKYQYSAESKMPGTYTVTATVTGKGNFTGTVTKKLTYTITAQTLAASRVKLNWTSNAYNGAVQKPTVVVTSAQGKTMTEGTSYTVTYKYSANSKIPGTYTVTATVTGKGNFTGTVTKEFTYQITAQPLASSRVKLSWTSKAYNGAVQKPTVVVTSAQGNTMTEGASYTVTYQYSAESKKPGTYTVTATVTGKGNFTGTVTKKLTYNITKQAINASRVTLNWTSKAYSGAVQKPTVVVTSAQGNTMTEGASYTVAYQYSAESKKPGTYTVTATVTGKGNFTGTVTKKLTYTITAQALAASRVKLNWTSKAYNGAVQKPTVVVTSAQGNTMTEGVSYTVTYQYSAESKKPGTYTVTATVTGNGNFTGTVTKKLTYNITKQAINASRVKLNWTSKAYNGAVQKPSVVVTSAQGKTMTEGASYTVAYQYSAESKKPGTYTVTATVTGKGNFTGTVTKKLSYTVTAQPLAASRVKLSWTSKAYNGKVQQPTVTVTSAQGGVMTEGSSYTVVYSDGCKAKGTYTVTVTGKGMYTGKVVKEFTIK